MYTEIKSLPENARVWYYQAGRDLTSEEQVRVSDFLKDSIGSWVTHGSPMRGSFSLLHNRLLVIAADVDFQSPSGCSIDSSTRWLKTLREELNVDFFDRSIAFFSEGKLQFVSLFKVKDAVKQGLITEETKVINQQISSLGELASNFEVVANKTFLKKYFEAVIS